MAWFKRSNKNISTSTEEKKEVPEGLWYKCNSCKATIPTADLVGNNYICPKCDYHARIGSEEYFGILFDNNEFTEIAANLSSSDPLEFFDTKSYKDRIVKTRESSGLNDAMRAASGEISAQKAVICCMDLYYIGGSMGSVVGEKIARGVDEAIKNNCAFIIISKSGGARMMEAAFSLMQMAKSSAKLHQLSEKKLPYISILTDPTTGGVTASYAMLGDVNIAEPNALIGFAGPRVIKETIKKDLPKGFQLSEMVIETGFLDLIVNRNELKKTVAKTIKMLTSNL